MPAPEPSRPTIGRHRGNVDFPAPAFPSKCPSPFGPPDPRDTWLEREAGTYLRLRRVRLAQRAPISAATPVSLMELLCRLKTEERAHLVWLSQDSEGAISPAETLSSTGSWGTPEAGAMPHCVFFIIPLSSLIPHSPAPARSGQVGIAQPAPEFDSALVWVAPNGLREGACAVSAAPPRLSLPSVGAVPSSPTPHQGHCC